MRAGAALAGLCLLAAPALAQESKSLTLAEITTLPDEQLARRIFGPLAPSLLVANRPGETSALRRNWDVWFWTRAHKDWLRPGICASTRIIVHLERGLGGDRTNPALTMRAIETQATFLIQNRAFADHGSGFDPEKLEPACQAVDPRWNSIPADSSWQLMKALSIANELGAAARAGRSPVPIDCTRIHFSGEPPASEAACLEEISGLGERMVYGVASCGDTPMSIGACIRIQTPDWFVYVQLDRDQKMARVAIEGIEDTSAVQ